MTHPTDQAKGPEEFAMVAANLDFGTESMGRDLGDYPDPKPASAQAQTTWDDWHEGPPVSPPL